MHKVCDTINAIEAYLKSVYLDFAFNYNAMHLTRAEV